MADKDVRLTAVEGGVPLAKTVAYPKLTQLKVQEQKDSWKQSIKQAEVQVQQSYMSARMYPADPDVQEKYRENVEALQNLRDAHEEWLKSLSVP